MLRCFRHCCVNARLGPIHIESQRQRWHLRMSMGPIACIDGHLVWTEQVKSMYSFPASSLALTLTFVVNIALLPSFPVQVAVVVPKCFIKHMCFIVLYFHGHAFFSLEIVKKCFFCALFFWKICFIFVSYLSGWNIYFKFLFITLKWVSRRSLF